MCAMAAAFIRRWFTHLLLLFNSAMPNDMAAQPLEKLRPERGELKLETETQLLGLDMFISDDLHSEFDDLVDLWMSSNRLYSTGGDCKGNLEYVARQLSHNISSEFRKFCLVSKSHEMICQYLSEMGSTSAVAVLSKLGANPASLFPRACTKFESLSDDLNFLSKKMHKLALKRKNLLVNGLVETLEENGSLSCRECIRTGLTEAARVLLILADCHEKPKLCKYVKAHNMTYTAQLIMLYEFQPWNDVAETCILFGACTTNAEEEASEEAFDNYLEGKVVKLDNAEETSQVQEPIIQFQKKLGVSKLSLQRRNPTDAEMTVENAVKQRGVNGYRLHTHRGSHWGRTQENMDEIVSQWLAEKDSRRRRKHVQGRNDRQLIDAVARNALDVSEKKAFPGSEGLMRHFRDKGLSPEKAEDIMKRLQRLSHRGGGFAHPRYSGSQHVRGRHLIEDGEKENLVKKWTGRLQGFLQVLKLGGAEKDEEETEGHVHHNGGHHHHHGHDHHEKHDGDHDEHHHHGHDKHNETDEADHPHEHHHHGHHKHNETDEDDHPHGHHHHGHLKHNETDEDDHPHDHHHHGHDKHDETGKDDHGHDHHHGHGKHSKNTDGGHGEHQHHHHHEPHGDHDERDDHREDHHHGHGKHDENGKHEHDNHDRHGKSDEDDNHEEQSHGHEHHDGEGDHSTHYHRRFGGKIDAEGSLDTGLSLGKTKSDLIWFGEPLELDSPLGELMLLGVKDRA